MQEIFRDPDETRNKQVWAPALYSFDGRTASRPALLITFIRKWLSGGCLGEGDGVAEGGELVGESGFAVGVVAGVSVGVP
ncbi:MAG: hypothetical protein GEV10_29515, partial [Streptosporangiales bacterium]|nr:hypothetical protein [Streptosporangiales bacterium]